MFIVEPEKLCFFSSAEIRSGKGKGFLRLTVYSAYDTLHVV